MVGRLRRTRGGSQIMPDREADLPGLLEEVGADGVEPVMAGQSWFDRSEQLQAGLRALSASRLGARQSHDHGGQPWFRPR